MSDLISRQEAIDALDTIGYDFSESELSASELEEVCEAVGNVRQDMISRINKLPSANPEQKKGKWINHIERGLCECMNCGEMLETERAYRANFCLNCGQALKAGEEDG